MIPNPFDVGSAKALQQLGFKALASTSAGFAWTIGKADNHVTVDDVCTHLEALCAAVDLPVNADFEGGPARRRKGRCQRRPRREDRRCGPADRGLHWRSGKPLYDRAHAIERIRAARGAIDAEKSGVLLTGRCEAFLVGQPDLNLVIDRLSAYADAGAECLYAPGIKTQEQIAAVVKAVAPKPVNLLIGPSGLSVAQARRSPASAGSVSAARWRARRGPVSCGRRARSPNRGPSPKWQKATLGAN